MSIVITPPLQTSTPNPGMPPAWRRALPALVLLLLAVLLAYRQTGLGMVAIWERSDTFAHAFVVPPIALWLVWRMRAQLARLTPSPAPWVLLPMVAIGLMWMLGELAAANSVSQLALMALLVLSVPAVLGLQVAWAMVFPLCFLFFAVPIGEFLMPQFMQWTADFTVLALRMTGIPVYREGLLFVIPSGNWSVVEACSGIRYLMASFMVGSLFAYINYRSTRRRVIFAVISVLVPVVANWVRAYLTVLLGHISGNKLATGADHLVYGWVFFGIVIFLLFMIGARWTEPDLPAPTGPAPAATRPRGGPPWWVALAGVAIVLLPLAGMEAIGRHDAGATPVVSLPQTLAGGWQAAPPAVDFVPAYVAPSATAQQAYAQAGKTVGVYVGYYRQQDDKRKLVSSDNALVTSKNHYWNQVDSGQQRLMLDQGKLDLHTGELLAAPVPGQTARPRMLVWQFYWVNGSLTASDALAKIYSAVHRLLGHGDESAVVIVYTADDASDPGGANAATLESFMRVNLSILEARLRETRNGK